jgi:MoxR-like ATPase
MNPTETAMPATNIVSAPEIYIADRALEMAARVAVELGQPLLLTGEPGTGKTSFAAFLASRLAPAWLGLDRPLPLFKFDTKSTSVASDLFYRFDNLRRLHAIHDPSMSPDNRDYISFEALGLAILLTRPRAEVRDLGVATLSGAGPGRSVVLVDEIDKAPRDFPNDILNEVEQMYFRIPELRDDAGAIRVVRAEPELKPLMVLTSNSEKNLPAAFLRRCIFHHIEFPERKYKLRMTDIIASNLTRHPRGRLNDEAVDFFYTLREDRSMQKPPATAELVQWMRLLHGRLLAREESGAADLPLTALSLEELSGTLGTLAKNVDDLRRAQQHAASLYPTP